MKRFAVLLLALAMAVCCAMPAFAAGTIAVSYTHLTLPTIRLV